MPRVVLEDSYCVSNDVESENIGKNSDSPRVGCPWISHVDSKGPRKSRSTTEIV